MLRQIVKELRISTGLRRRKRQSKEDFVDQLMVEAYHIPNRVWEALSPETQTFVNFMVQLENGCYGFSNKTTTRRPSKGRSRRRVK